MTDRVCRKALDLAIWLYTEADGKYKTRYRSAAAVGVTDTGRLTHEHVFPGRVLVARLLAEPEQCEETMRSGQGCCILREEHSLLAAAERADGTLEGWDRYRAAGIEVIDLVSGIALEPEA